MFRLTVLPALTTYKGAEKISAVPFSQASAETKYGHTEHTINTSDAKAQVSQRTQGGPCSYGVY